MNNSIQKKDVSTHKKENEQPKSNLIQNKACTSNAEKICTSSDGRIDYQKKIAQLNLLIFIMFFIAITSLVFLIDSIALIFFFVNILPLYFLGIGIILIIYSIIEKKRHRSFSIALICGLLSFIYPIIIFLILIFSFKIGAPIPS